MPATVSAQIEEFYNVGYLLIPNVYRVELMSEIKTEFYEREADFVEIQKKQGIYESVVDATHHTFILCRKMLMLLEKSRLTDFIDEFFQGESYILNTMGLSKIRPFSQVYTQNIHRDIRSFHGSTSLWINTLIMLDDSTADNGATWVMPGSEELEKKPSESDFWASAKQIEGRCGDVLIFHGGLWHCAGQNKTNDTRHIITPFFSRPFIKQQLDYPKAFGDDFGRICSPHIRQMLGYNARVPITLEDFYQHDDHRFYKKNQG